jgi:EAL domain-containing protein (putative c-di-GMP-specific phosphodiesterase class I)/CheY-like chemotaxis protein
MARILVVDDEPGVRKAARRVLSRAGHEVDEAPDAPTAIRMAGGVHYAAAVVDSDLPGGVSGLQVCTHLRELQPACMRVLAVEGTQREEAARAFQFGEVQRLLAKPFQAEALEQAVAGVLETAKQFADFVESQRDAGGMDRMFQECLVNSHLSLVVQPILRGRERRPFAVECLLRSRHPVLPSPLAVLDAVERSGRVTDLGREVNRMAAEWARRLPPDLQVFVNTHCAQFQVANLHEHFEPLLPVADRVVLEITERAPLSTVPQWEAAVRELTDAGFRVAIDDLGSGYNGLVMLADLQPSFIKVDMSITRNIDRVPRKQRLVHLLGNFAAATAAELVAEGVETEDECATLLEQGADLLQGYLFGKPSAEYRAGA